MNTPRLLLPVLVILAASPLHAAGPTAPAPPPVHPIQRAYLESRIGKDAGVVQAEREYLATQNVQVLQILDQATEGLHRYANPARDAREVPVSGVPNSLIRLLGPISNTRRTFEQAQLLEAGGLVLEGVKVLRDLPTDAVMAERYRALLAAYPPETAAPAIAPGADSDALEAAFRGLSDYDRLRYAYLERRRLGLQPELILDTLALAGWTFARLADSAAPAGKAARASGDDAAFRLAVYESAVYSGIASDAYLILGSLLEADAFRPKGAPAGAVWERAADRFRCTSPKALRWAGEGTDVLLTERERALHEARLEYEGAAGPLLGPLQKSGTFNGRRSFGGVPQRWANGFLDGRMLSAAKGADPSFGWSSWMELQIAEMPALREWIAKNPSPPVAWWENPPPRSGPAPPPQR